MRKPIAIQAEFIATALTMILARKGESSITFSKDEFDELGLGALQLELHGEFDHEDDEIPTAVTFSVEPRDDLY